MYIIAGGRAPKPIHSGNVYKKEKNIKRRGGINKSRKEKEGRLYSTFWAALAGWEEQVDELPPPLLYYIPVHRTWRAIGEGKKDGGALFPNCAADNEQHKTQSR